MWLGVFGPLELLRFLCITHVLGARIGVSVFGAPYRCQDILSPTPIQSWMTMKKRQHQETYANISFVRLMSSSFTLAEAEDFFVAGCGCRCVLFLDWACCVHPTPTSNIA